MNEKIFEDYGIVITKRDGRLYIRYDAGHIVTEMKEQEISPEQSSRAQLNEREAHKVLLEIEGK